LFGLGFGFGLFFIGVGVIYWVKILMFDEEVVEECYEFCSFDEMCVGVV